MSATPTGNLQSGNAPAPRKASRPPRMPREESGGPRSMSDTPNAFESQSSCLFQVNSGTLFSLGDGVDVRTKPKTI